MERVAVSYVCAGVSSQYAELDVRGQTLATNVVFILAPRARFVWARHCSEFRETKAGGFGIFLLL